MSVESKKQRRVRRRDARRPGPLVATIATPVEVIPPKWEELVGELRPPRQPVGTWQADVETASNWVHPVASKQQLREGVVLDHREQGSAFFVTMGERGGLFLTAKHVIESHDRDEKPYSLLIRGEKPGEAYWTPVRQLLLHPRYDAAIGTVRLHRPETPLPVGRRRLKSGEPFIAFGFPHSQGVEFPFEGGRGFATNYIERRVPSTVDEYWDEKHPFGPGYMHRATLGGGISGGPVVSCLDWRVYALNSLGGEGALMGIEIALPLHVLLDWRIDFWDGAPALGDLLEQHERGRP